MMTIIPFFHMIKGLIVEIIKRKVTLFLLVIFLLVGVMIGVFFTRVQSNISKLFEPRSEYRSGYTGLLTNPLLDCDSYENTGIVKLIPLKSEIESIRQSAIDNGNITEMSVYYRDLGNGSWVGVNLDEKFAPASLLKVPVMIAYLKKAEKDPTIFQKTITIQDNPNISKLTQEIHPIRYAKVGETYTVEELINLMISSSDNVAKYGLTQQLEQNSVGEVFVDLGLVLPKTNIEDNFMSVRDYSTFFRVLYNATYLNREMSEKALSYLTKNDYDNGLRSGLPANMVIASKFGERSIEDEKTGKVIHQLHDCGIVYFQNNPYIACVMTRGESFEKMGSIIGDVSRAIYNHTVDAQQ